MKLYIQFGYGMMDHTGTLLDEWRDGGVLLSPRDLDSGQLERMARRLRESPAEVLLDPQCFVHDADHYRLTEHDYWKIYRECSTAGIATGDGAGRLIDALAVLNERLGASRFIVPGLLAAEVTEDWCGFHESLLRAAQRRLPDESLIATVALSAPVVLDEAQVEAVVERLRSWPVQVFYVIAETPTSYLVDDPNWLANLLILTSGLKLLRREVIVGYGNHQLLALAAAGVDAIAAGTWLNVRAFPVEKFYTPDEGEVSRRATWYYAPRRSPNTRYPFSTLPSETMFWI